MAAFSQTVYSNIFLLQITVVTFKFDWTVIPGGQTCNIDPENGLVSSKQAGNKPSPESVMTAVPLASPVDSA